MAEGFTGKIIMTTSEALNKVLNFRKLLDLLDRGEGRAGTRSEINQSLPLVRRIIGMPGTGKTLTIAPPPLVGGMIMQNVNPFDMLFSVPYGMFQD